MADSVEEDGQRFLAHHPHSLGFPSLFYGSLQAPEIFQLVVGAPLDCFSPQRVSLVGYRSVTVISGDAFPGIVPDRNAAPLSCLLVEGMTDEQKYRVAWYEWDEYRVAPFELSYGQRAEAFIPDIETIERLHGPVSYEDWRYEDWCAHHLEKALPGTKTWMDRMPDIASLVSDSAQKTPR